jgi:hypothetical protein
MSDRRIPLHEPCKVQDAPYLLETELSSLKGGRSQEKKGGETNAVRNHWTRDPGRRQRRGSLGRLLTRHHEPPTFGKGVRRMQFETIGPETLGDGDGGAHWVVF